jgi:hypothetical protein
MNHDQIWVVTIHDKAKAGYLAFDMKDVLDALWPSIRTYWWYVLDLDCTGTDCDAVQEQLLTFQTTGRPVSSDVLRASFSRVEQTIDATIVGAAHESAPAPQPSDVFDLDRFSMSEMEIVIRAVDSTLFEVMTRVHAHVELLGARFTEVHQEDLENYRRSV